MRLRFVRRRFDSMKIEVGPKRAAVLAADDRFAADA